MAGPEESSTDFLSQLGSDILICILRCLHPDEATRMSSLARSWRHVPSLITSCPHLSLGVPSTDIIDPRSVFNREDIHRALTSDTTQLGICEIIPDESLEPGDIASWSESLARRGVRNLTLDFRHHLGPDAWSVVLCKSLFSLTLYQCSLLQQTQVRCVFLTTLRFELVRINDQMLLGLTSGCRNLATLKMIWCYGFKRLIMEDARMLKTLHLSCPPIGKDEAERIEIYAPNLKNLVLRTSTLMKGINIVAPSLKSLAINLVNVKEYLNRRHLRRMTPGLWRLIRGATQVSFLRLGGNTLESLSQVPMPAGFNMEFVNLKQFYTNLFIDSGPEVLCLAFLLQNFSKLEHLDLKVIEDDEERDVATPEGLVLEELKRRLEKSACISSCLQNVCLSSFTGHLYEMELSRFILTKARALKKMEIWLSFVSDDEGRVDAANSLLLLDRASPEGNLAIENVP